MESNKKDIPHPFNCQDMVNVTPVLNTDRINSVKLHQISLKSQVTSRMENRKNPSAALTSRESNAIVLDESESQVVELDIRNIGNYSSMTPSVLKYHSGPKQSIKSITALKPVEQLVEESEVVENEGTLSIERLTKLKESDMATNQVSSYFMSKR